MSTIRSSATCGITIKRNIQCPEDLVLDVLGLSHHRGLLSVSARLASSDEFNLSTFFQRSDVIRNKDIPIDNRQLHESFCIQFGCY
ncbi:hypothetical protein TNCV_2067031 [Trichonephila clavipes]|uniref:Uncharacterized protein n=1 Tax=Trichonephila clavipes TaxID=2585209 RepID=A0A8X6W2H2_TRICX|nr:hypothetical protein TNCV_2067031 [Trichonephila clavipes]